MKLYSSRFQKSGLFLLLFLSGLAPHMIFAQQTGAADETKALDSTATEAPPILKKLIEDIEADKRGSTAMDLEIDGLVVDETVTKAGRDFYQVFYNIWEAPPGAKNFTIEISEKPARGIATVVMIDINGQRVVEAPLQPRYDIVEQLAQQAAQRCYSYLLNYEDIQKQLSGEDLSGSGIY